jgi:hypothetical protein
MRSVPPRGSGWVRSQTLESQLTKVTTTSALAALPSDVRRGSALPIDYSHFGGCASHADRRHSLRIFSACRKGIAFPHIGRHSRQSLLTAHCPLPTAHCPLPTAHHSLLTAHCSPLTVHAFHFATSTPFTSNHPVSTSPPGNINIRSTSDA